MLTGRKSVIAEFMKPTVQLFLFSIFVILSFISYFNDPHFIVILYRLLSLLFK